MPNDGSSLKTLRWGPSFQTGLDLLSAPLVTAVTLVLEKLHLADYCQLFAGLIK